MNLIRIELGSRVRSAMPVMSIARIEMTKMMLARFGLWLAEISVNRPAREIRAAVSTINPITADIALKTKANPLSAELSDGTDISATGLTMLD